MGFEVVCHEKRRRDFVAGGHGGAIHKKDASWLLGWCLNAHNMRQDHMVEYPVPAKGIRVNERS